jgi:hypothetical protein
MGIVIACIAVYAASLTTYHLIANKPHALGKADWGTVTDSVVIITVSSIKPTENRMNVEVLALPDDSLMDTNNTVLKQDIRVRLYPLNDLGDLEFKAGKLPPQVSTTINVDGNAEAWPFDRYTTSPISADVVVGTGSDIKFLPARVEVTGALDGWNITSARSGDATQSASSGDDATITLRRAPGPLVFDLGICLVLVSLPVMALFVSISTLRRKRKFLPPLGTWFAAMLFAVVPLRNILPGSPPTGGWIDQALVLWVLVALAASMGMFIAAWYQQSD